MLQLMIGCLIRYQISTTETNFQDFNLALRQYISESVEHKWGRVEENMKDGKLRFCISLQIFPQVSKEHLFFCTF